MADERTRAFSGARAKLLINGTREAGWCTDINGTYTQQLARVDVCGDAKSQEIEVVGVSVSFSAGFVRMLKRSIKQMGIRVEGSTAQIINAPPMTVEVYDKVGDSPVYRILGAVFESLSFRVDARGLASNNCSFQAIDFKEVDVT